MDLVLPCPCWPKASPGWARASRAGLQAWEVVELGSIDLPFERVHGVRERRAVVLIKGSVGRMCDQRPSSEERRELRPPGEPWPGPCRPARRGRRKLSHLRVC